AQFCLAGAEPVSGCVHNACQCRRSETSSSHDEPSAARALHRRRVEHPRTGNGIGVERQVWNSTLTSHNRLDDILIDRAWFKSAKTAAAEVPCPLRQKVGGERIAGRCRAARSHHVRRSSRILYARLIARGGEINDSRSRKHRVE